MTQSMQETIREKLRAGLSPTHMEVENQSALHRGHAGDNGTGESHFRVVVVTSAFEGRSRVERQRMVYDLLRVELAHDLHALSVSALTDSEYKGM